MQIEQRYQRDIDLTLGRQKLRILSWNINGLRAVLRRKFGNISSLLNQLNADIICFQETKLTKGDFDRNLAIVEGWYAVFCLVFFSNLAHKGMISDLQI